MRSTLTLAIFFLSLSVSLSSFSQDSSFQLKDYKYRTSGYRALSVSAGMYGSYNNLEYKDPSDHKEKSSQWNILPLSVNYYSTYNTDKRIHTTSSSLWGTGVFSRNESRNDTLKTHYLRSRLTLGTEDLYYKGKSFLEWGGHLTTEFSSDSWIDSLETKTNNSWSELSFTLGGGKGRIENVRDAQMAMFILNDLKNQGLLSTQPDAEDYHQLASLITRINNKRIFDDRRRRIYELTQIDSFIRNKGLAITDIRHFTTINDNWSLAFNPYRFSGFRWFGRINPGVTWDLNHSKNEYNTSINKYIADKKSVFAGAEIGIENYKPVNLHWQHNWNVDLSARHNWDFSNYETNNNGQVSKSEFNTTEWVYTASVRYGLEYYPNNRTILSTSAQVSAAHSANYEYSQKSWMITPGITFRTDYFLGYRTRLFCNLSIHDAFTSNSGNGVNFDAEDFYTSFSFGISHNIF